MPNWSNEFDGRYTADRCRIQFQYRRVDDLDWIFCVGIGGEEDLEGFREWFDQNYTMLQIRDYVCRIVDVHSGHVYVQQPPTFSCSGEIGRQFLADFSEPIPWNYPGYNLLQKQNELEKRNMIKVGIYRIDNRLKLLVNAKEFHAELDKIGVAKSNTEYLDQPSAAATVATSNFQLSPKTLLTCQYKDVEILKVKKNDSGEYSSEKVSVPTTGVFDLSGLWSTPPSFEQLKRLCASAEPVARKILEHYQPIDISIEIQKKVLK